MMADSEAANSKSSQTGEANTGAFVGGVIVGAAVGAAAGAIAGLLAAPQDGRETRKVLQQSVDALPDLAKDVTTSVSFQTQQMVHSSLTGWEQALVRLRTAITTGLAVSQQERQRLSQPNASSDTNKTKERGLNKI